MARLNTIAIFAVVAVFVAVLIFTIRETTNSPTLFPPSSPVIEDESVAAPRKRRDINITSSSAAAKRLLQCATESSLQRGLVWNHGEGDCVRDPQMLPPLPLREYENRSDELFCRTSSSVFSFSRRWISNRHRADSSADDDIALTSSYRNFQLLSSFLFSQYLPWRPRIAKRVFDAKAKWRFRAFHDAASENLFRVENFCIDPLTGTLSGFAPQSSTSTSSSSSPTTYLGRDETRDYFHHDLGFRGFFGKVRNLGEPPVYLDERPVVFVPIGPLNRGNMWHTLHRFLSLVGILKRSPFGTESTSSSSYEFREVLSEEEDHLRRPLLVFVVDLFESSSSSSTQSSSSSSTAIPTAFGFLLRLLDLPWAAIVSATSFDVVETGSRALDDLLRAEFRRVGNAKGGVLLDEVLLQHNHQQSSSSATSMMNRKVLMRDRDAVANRSVCFRRGVAWQNCFACIGREVRAGVNDDGYAGARTESEAYSFGMWAPLTAARLELVREYRARMLRCMPLPALPSPSQSPVLLPLALLDLRTIRGRRMSDMAVFLHSIKHALRNVARLVAVESVGTTSSSSSRGEYIDLLRNADIFIGAHGAAFTGMLLMRNGTLLTTSTRAAPVVIEFTTRNHFCRRHHDPSAVASKRCWFKPYADALQLHHWIVELSDHGAGEGVASPMFVPAEAVVRLISLAATRFLPRGGRSSADADALSLPMTMMINSSDDEAIAISSAPSSSAQFPRYASFNLSMDSMPFLFTDDAFRGLLRVFELSAGDDETQQQRLKLASCAQCLREMRRAISSAKQRAQQQPQQQPQDKRAARLLRKLRLRTIRESESGDDDLHRHFLLHRVLQHFIGRPLVFGKSHIIIRHLQRGDEKNGSDGDSSCFEGKKVMCSGKKSVPCFLFEFASS